MIKKRALILLLAFTASISFAQQKKIAFEKYGVGEGLPEEWAIDPLQDDKGFIWFGTQNGLVKYDGYRFKVFKATPNQMDTTNFQSRNLLGGLLKTKDGKIWIGESLGKGGLSYFDPHTEKFKTFYPEGKTTNAEINKGNAMLFEDEAGNIWFKSFTDVFRKFHDTYSLNPTNGVIKKYPLADRNSRFSTHFNTLESSGTVWLLDEKNNLQRLNRQKDRFEIIIPAGKNIGPSGKADNLRQISKATANRLLLTGSHGLYVFDSKQLKIVKSYVHQPNNANSIADSILWAKEDLKGQIWLTYRQGKISLIDPVSNNIQTFTYGTPPLPYQKGITQIQFFFVTAQNKEGILFHAWAGLGKSSFFIQYQFATKTFSIFDYNFNLPANPLPQNPFPYNSLQDHSGLLWLGTRPGLYKQAPKKQQMDLFRYRADEPNGLPSDSIRYLFEDSKKRLWIGTRNGLALYQANQGNFKVFKNNPSNASSISNNAITAVQEDADGKIWVGTRNGLNLWQEATSSFKRFFYSPKEVNNIAFLFPDKQQRLWLSIRDKGVFVLDKNTGRLIKSFIPDAKNPASLSSKQIDVFYQDSKRNIWLGDGGDNQFGLYRLNEREDGFTHFLPVSGDSTSISSNEIIFLAEDEKNRLWIGTDGGLNLYHPYKNNFTVFRNFELSSTIYFTTDKRGEPWFATYSGYGLVSVNAEKGTFTAYDESKGLLQNGLIGGQNGRIVKDEFGRFWLPTERGLSVFDPEKKSFVSYFQKDGFQAYDRSYRGIKTSNGDIWIGSNNGLNRIVPANLLKKDTTLPSIVITQMSINDSLYSKPDGTIFKQSVPYTNAIELKHWQKNLSFDFVALHYLRSEDNQYSWKLENYDKNWSAPSKERKVSYTNLSPGTYIFRVKASNADGVWKEEGISLTITILPPWWLTWWAYILYALMFLGALRTFSLWRERKLRQEKEQLQHKVEERTSELKQSLEDLKSTQSQLIQSEKMASLGELTAGIAHEIQNPLNFVNNFSDVSNELIKEMKEEFKKGDVEEGFAIADDIEQNLEKINHHGKRASDIVKGMLEHSRKSTGEKELTDINALCDEYLRLAYHGLKAKDNNFNATMETHFDSNLPKIDIIPQDIGRVLLNLVNNAFYAVNERANLLNLEKQSGDANLTDLAYNPTVSITTQLTADNQLLIAIKDNGSGIPNSIKDKIFQPFFTTKPTGQGTGLGLSLSYDIVKAHGGELNVETKEGEGSEFIVRLPL
jgi:signal transduction histidine kinase/ligand-binding sensor domain-containing protein